MAVQTTIYCLHWVLVSYNFSQGFSKTISAVGKQLLNSQSKRNPERGLRSRVPRSKLLSQGWMWQVYPAGLSSHCCAVWRPLPLPSLWRCNNLQWRANTSKRCLQLNSKSLWQLDENKAMKHTQTAQCFPNSRLSSPDKLFFLNPLWMAGLVFE